MHPKSPRWLKHIVDAGAAVLEWSSSRTLADYEADYLLRSAVERNFEIMGEALLRIERTDPATSGRIPDSRQVIGFRNRLVHGYDTTDHAKVWHIIQNVLPTFISTVETLLREAEESKSET